MRDIQFKIGANRRGRGSRIQGTVRFGWLVVCPMYDRWMTHLVACAVETFMMVGPRPR